jgi:hypothetical protein
MKIITTKEPVLLITRDFNIAYAEDENFYYIYSYSKAIPKENAIVFTLEEFSALVEENSQSFILICVDKDHGPGFIVTSIKRAINQAAYFYFLKTPGF